MATRQGLRENLNRRPKSSRHQPKFVQNMLAKYLRPSAADNINRPVERIRCSFALMGLMGWVHVIAAVNLLSYRCLRHLVAHLELLPPVFQLVPRHTGRQGSREQLKGRVPNAFG